MKRLLCCCLALMMLLPFAAAENKSWSDEEWAMMAAALSGDEQNPIPEGYRLRIRENQIGTDAKMDPQWKLMLLMSTDAQDILENYGRSDVLMLCAVHKKTGEMRLLFLPEDGSVAVEGLQRQIRLRYVNCFGGPYLTLSSVNRALGLNMDRYCAVNFSAFVEIVDALGGVPITLSADEAQAMEKQAGVNLLSGEEALRFVRLRRQDEDGLRPRRLLEAVLEQILNDTSFDRAMALVEILLPALDTNLTMNDLMDLGFALLDQENPGAVSTHRLSAPLNEEAARECHAFLFDKGE